MKQQARYRIRNWKQYNQALVNRGSITFWIDQNSLRSWLFSKTSTGRGRPCIYSDQALICALTIRAFYQLPLRATEGFLISILQLLGVNIPTPDYTTLSRRAKNLNCPLKKFKVGESLNILIDSTGLKVFGEGEWKVRKYGYFSRRTWRKLHISYDPDKHEVCSAVLTDNSCHDSKIGPDILKGIPEEVNLVEVIGDGAYDPRDTRNAIATRGAKAIIPPCKGATLRKKGKYGPGLKERNKAIQEIMDYGEDGLAKWKKLKDYHRRSLVEVGMFRLKQIFGPTLKSREFTRQQTEASIRCYALNKVTSLGMPKSEKI